MTHRFALVGTPLGVAVAVASRSGLAALQVTPHPEHALEQLARRHGVAPRPDPAVAAGLAPQLDEYFAGTRRSFDVTLDWAFVTGFARDALRAVCEIPYGETASYGEVAARAGRPRAHRAVGTACRTAPFSLVVPVHRVIRSDGSIGEYGGATESKRFLLDLERQASSVWAGAGR